MVAIRLEEGNHEMRERSVKLVTIFGSVYAPKSVCKIKNGSIEVPEWVFYNKGLNPCQMVTGFTER